MFLPSLTGLIVELRLRSTRLLRLRFSGPVAPDGEEVSGNT